MSDLHKLIKIIDTGFDGSNGVAIKFEVSKNRSQR